ncbi:NADH dehydrogenase [ubiquinone] 1 alpha subcomplex subunit 5 [Venturia canescens]|uniref:NADH dehydrogenase [ubiquinone] 1 alpha subcomplex subunit 5 n=1 Tax=Venturia canescens TaxID=32260 RepID=UPI001C9C00BD|nr:NADH dehydrogenase [ubiquinone] 1 alpha subcomplex subunit 5 [Venturia canescens]
MAGVLKKTTGLTGLAVAKNPHYNLGILYDKILRTLQKLPNDYAYKIHTEKLIKERESIIKTTPNIAEVERKIACGQIEELIVQAENELILVRNMAVWKPWEPLQETAPPHQWSWPPHK